MSRTKSIAKFGDLIGAAGLKLMPAPAEPKLKPRYRAFERPPEGFRQMKFAEGLDDLIVKLACKSKRPQEEIIRDIAAYVAVTTASVNAWLVEQSVPIEDHFWCLVDAFPLLRFHVRPDTLSKSKPGSATAGPTSSKSLPAYFEVHDEEKSFTDAVVTGTPARAPVPAVPVPAVPTSCPEESPGIVRVRMEPGKPCEVPKGQFDYCDVVTIDGVQYMVFTSKAARLEARAKNLMKSGLRQFMPQLLDVLNEYQKQGVPMEEALVKVAAATGD